jgi:hypothetical protein
MMLEWAGRDCKDDVDNGRIKSGDMGMRECGCGCG